MDDGRGLLSSKRKLVPREDFPPFAAIPPIRGVTIGKTSKTEVLPKSPSIPSEPSGPISKRSVRVISFLCLPVKKSWLRPCNAFEYSHYPPLSFLIGNF